MREVRLLPVAAAAAAGVLILLGAGNARAYRVLDSWKEGRVLKVPTDVALSEP